MERHSLELLNLQILAERAVSEKIQRMRELESQLSAQCCRVCGDRASGRHYGVPSCDGCRGFFKRSVRRNIGYTCKYTSSCVVDLKRRNQCQFCRFQRCLMVGMNRHAVQHERLPRKHRQMLTSTGAYSSRQFSLSASTPPMPQLPCIADMASQGHPSPSIPTSPSLFYSSLSPGLASPTMLSPTMLPPFSKFSLLPPPPPLHIPQATHPPMCLMPVLSRPSTSTPSNPSAKSTKGNCSVITENTPPSESSSTGSPPGSPVTPCSKRTSEYSIESLLKVADVSKRKSIVDLTRKGQELHLTPPSTPPRVSASPSIIPEYQAQVQQSLLQILRTTTCKVSNSPAFRDLTVSDQRKLIDGCWLQIFLIALYEFDFPIESLSVYLQSVSERHSGLPALQEATLQKIEDGLLKLKELGVDRTETSYLKALALFNPARVSTTAKSYVEKIQEQAQCMLAEYDRNYFPGSIARNGKLILALTNLQNLEQSVSRLLFPCAKDVEDVLSVI